MRDGDSDVLARALEAIRAAGQRAMRGHPTVDDTLTLAEIAAAGLALRVAWGPPVEICGCVRCDATRAYDARIRAALAPDADAGEAPKPQ